MTVPLEPCPLCGGPADIYLHATVSYATVGCIACDCRVRQKDAATAVATWNRRQPAPPIKELQGAIPVVLYFPTREDADEFISVARSVFAKEVEIKLP